jgi:sugar lactone lactonase YvrE
MLPVSVWLATAEHSPKEREPFAAMPTFAALAAGIGRPAAIAIDRTGALYLAAPDVGAVFRTSGPEQLTLVAGAGAGGPASDPRLSPAMPQQPPAPSVKRPVGISVDPDGNAYLVDDVMGAILRLDALTHALTIVVCASRPPSDLSPAPLPATAFPVRPWALAIDRPGRLYVSDRALHAVFRVTLPAVTVDRIAGSLVPGYVGNGGPAAQARLMDPQGIALDPAGNLFIADRGNHAVRRVDGRTGLMDTIAGNGFAGFSGDGGPGRSAQLHDPVALAIGPSGDLFIADLGNRRIRRLSARTGLITTVRGLEHVSSGAVTVSATGSLLATDLDRWTVFERRHGGATTVVAGNGTLGWTGDGGLATAAHLVRPAALARDSLGNVYVADEEAQRVRRIDVRSGVVSTVAGNGGRGFSGDGGPATRAELDHPQGIAFDRQGCLLIADSGNHRIRRVTADGTITTVAGTGRDDMAEDGARSLDADLGRCSGVAVESTGAMIVLQGPYGLIHRITTDGVVRRIVDRRSADTVGEEQASAFACVRRIRALTVTANDRLLFFDEESLRLWLVDRETGKASVFAGRGRLGPMGPADEAGGLALGSVLSLASDDTGQVCFGEVGDGISCLAAAPTRRLTIRSRVRQITVPAGLLFGDDGVLYVADAAGLVWRLDAEGTLTPFAGGAPGF